MAKPKYLQRLYVVSIAGGKTHPEFGKFLANVMAANGKEPDYGGIQRVALVSHAVDDTTLQLILSDGMKRRDDVEVEEITTATLDGPHRGYIDVVEYFLKYKTYPNITI